MDLSAIALQGIDQAEAGLEAAASGLPSAAGLSADGAAPDTVTLSSEVVALLSARDQFSVGVATLKIADETQKSAVNLLA